MYIFNDFFLSFTWEKKLRKNSWAFFLLITRCQTRRNVTGKFKPVIRTKQKQLNFFSFAERSWPSRSSRHDLVNERRFERNATLSLVPYIFRVLERRFAMVRLWNMETFIKTVKYIEKKNSKQIFFIYKIDRQLLEVWKQMRRKKRPAIKYSTITVSFFVQSKIAKILKEK